MIITAVSALDPRMQPGVYKYMRRCAEEGILTIVLETARELATQMAYYSRGRAPGELVKAYFARCGLWAITDAETQTINTQTLYSKHIDKLAIDIAPAKDGKPWWEAPLREVWEKMWRIAEEECGLDACAGGKWEAWTRSGRPWDLPHHEYKFAPSVSPVENEKTGRVG